MNDPLDDRILELLACPLDGGRLVYSSENLKCTHCHSIYEIRGGIPLLYPDDIDMKHLEEEEKLGSLMEDPPALPKERSYQQQWELSKQEFWSFVEEKTRGGGYTILNAGCGIDRRFLELGDKNTAVAFDLTHSLLSSLRSNYGSPHNIAGDVHRLPFRHESFDCLCCIDLLHHETEDLRLILRSFYDTLRPGGKLFLEDVNAWGVFQFWKSIFLPRSAHRKLRSSYHRLKRSGIQPAGYEFPTSVWKVKRALEEVGFRMIETVPLESYPLRNSFLKRIYRSIAAIDRVRRYHNFHYFLFAEKP
ncbi:MAG: methyltransferase domain-containing protein [Candidatus Krumholzibacteriota bacterium]|nr:methyltransferase domain-containing protein [Candidatus Krumholzibacteriota bacterium]